MFGFGILSGLLILPLVGAAFILTLRGDSEAARSNARWAALATTIATFLLSLVAWAPVRYRLGRFQLVESHAWLAETIRFKLGVDGFSMPLILLTTFLMPFCILASWDSIETPGEGIFRRFPGPRNHDDRRVLRARPRAVLPVLRGRPHPDVPHHRHLGRQAAHLRELQVLPLHAARLGADAARHHGHVLARRHDRHPDAAAATSSRRTCRSGCGSPSSPPSR